MNDAPTEPRKTEREIFLEAVERATPGERAAFLDKACAHDPVLRAAVQALLRHDKEDSFMQSPALARQLAAAATQDQPGTPPPAAVGLIFPPSERLSPRGERSVGAPCGSLTAMTVTADRQRRVLLPPAAKSGDRFALDLPKEGRFVLTRLARPTGEARLVRKGRYVVAESDQVITWDQETSVALGAMTEPLDPNPGDPGALRAPELTRIGLPDSSPPPPAAA